MKTERMDELSAIKMALAIGAVLGCAFSDGLANFSVTLAWIVSISHFVTRKRVEKPTNLSDFVHVVSCVAIAASGFWITATVVFLTTNSKK